MGALSWFIPQEKQFFDMIEKQSENVLDGVDAFIDMLEHYDMRDIKLERIKELEGKGDKMVHDIINELNKTFITPIDREDITGLVSSLDDILDYVEAVAVSMVLYKIPEPDSHMRNLSMTLQRGAREVNKAISLLRDFKEATHIREHIMNVNTIENEADVQLRKAMAELFDDGKDAVHIIKMKELYDNLETATDKCEDAADVIGDILVKYT